MTHALLVIEALPLFVDDQPIGLYQLSVYDVPLTRVRTCCDHDHPTPLEAMQCPPAVVRASRMTGWSPAAFTTTSMEHADARYQPSAVA